MVLENEHLNFLSLRKNLKKDSSAFPIYRIALLGDSSTQMLRDAISGYAYEVGMNFEIYESDYDQVEHEIYNASSGLYEFNPDFIVLFHSSRKLLANFFASVEEHRADFSEHRTNSLRALLDTLNERLNSKIIYCNFVEITDNVFGNYGNKVPSSFIFQLRKLNFELMKLGVEYKNLFINDVASLNNRFGSQFSFDPKIYVNADFVFSLDFTAWVAKNAVDIILPLIGKLKKCLILDLDNTLWGGIIGDDGMENIQIGNLGIGKAFTELQKWARELKQRGIILAINSQNTEQIAKEPFEKHPEMILRLEDISLFVANWNSKAENIRYIQSVLNIGFDSMVFVDDNPFERELVKRELPEVTVPDLPEDPSRYFGFLSELNLFETGSFSKEDVGRTKQYQEEATRTILKKSFALEEDYLSSLAMCSQVASFNAFNAPRIAQLTQRSNQFNLRTVRYTEAEIGESVKSAQFHSLAFDLKDRFGEYGLIAAVFLREESKGLFIENWVMSCRVLKRGMEQFIINEMVRIARNGCMERIVGEYIPTTKNGIVKELYPSLNFMPENERWVLPTANFTPHKTFIDAKY